MRCRSARAFRRMAASHVVAVACMRTGPEPRGMRELPRPCMAPLPLPARLRGASSALLAWAGVAACVAGLLLHRMDRAVPWARVRDQVVLAALAIIVAAVLRYRLAGSWASALGCVWVAALVFFAGPMPVLAAILLAAAACSLGSLLLPGDARARNALAVPVGLALLGGCAGWLLLLPLHHQGVHAAALLALCLARRRALGDAARGALDAWRAAVAAAPVMAAFAVMLLGLASTAAWLPTMQFDDLAYHLGLPSELQRHGAYRPDPANQIWALAPWLGDVVQGIAQVLAGREARGATNALWMLACASALWWFAATLRLDARARWLAIALFASLPPLAALAAGMQTELPAACLLLCLAVVVAGPHEPRLLPAAAVLAGGLFALKSSHALAALVLLGWALARWHGRVDGRRLLPALALFVLVAGSSYVFAAAISGNPLLPLFNDVFRSPFLAARQLEDPRWHAGFGVDLPWRMTFRTAAYLEAEPGGFGFVLVALSGAWLLALLRPATRTAALVASLVLLVPLVPLQYARYAFPGMVLLLVPMLGAATAALGWRRAAVVLVALCVLDLGFQANAHWLLGVKSVRNLVRSGGDAVAVFERFAPERALIAELRRRDDGDSIVLALDPGMPAVAELAGRGRSVAHYAPALEAARLDADADASGTRWQRLIGDLGARWLLLRPARLTDPQRRALVALDARRVAGAGEAELWSVGDAGAHGEVSR